MSITPTQCEDACTGLGNVYRDSGELSESSVYFRKAMELPTCVTATVDPWRSCLGIVFDEGGSIMMRDTLSFPSHANPVGRTQARSTTPKALSTWATTTAPSSSCR